jgi:hypothetical protein
LKLEAVHPPTPLGYSWLAESFRATVNGVVVVVKPQLKPATFKAWPPGDWRRMAMSERLAPFAVVYCRFSVKEVTFPVRPLTAIQAALVQVPEVG